MAGPLVPLSEDPAEQVWCWRYRQLRRWGFDEIDAEHLAESDADLHQTAELLEAGCSHELATKILT